MTGDPRGPVVVGVDGSVEANRAAEVAAWEAHRRRVPMRLLFAHRSTPMWGPATIIRDDYEWERDAAREALTAAQERVLATYPELTTRAVVVSGSPAAALVEASKGASLVVLGTRASGGVKGRLSGSVAAQVAAHSHTPVIVVPRRTQPTGAAVSSAAVVVGMDGSTQSELALRFAIDEAVARDAEIMAVYVWSPLSLDDFDVLPPAEYPPADYDRQAEQDTAMRLLTEATEGWSDRYPDLKISRRVIESHDATEALASASEGAGLLVVGSRGHGGFLGLRLGSTVDGLVRSATVPVAVVRE